MSTKLNINSLTLSLGNSPPILSDISLNIPPRQITGLIGPSGSGKSTLLRCLNRLWEPPKRSVWLEGIDITELNVLDLRRRVGMLFQSAALFEGTVAKNIAYGPGLIDQNLSPKRIAELLDMSGLKANISQKSTNELSGGQAQRVALARTLANQPDVLLLDEPTSALDPAATRRVEETVLHLRDTLGLTVVWVSHAIEQVQRIADTVVLLVDGKIIETGPPQHLLSGTHHHLTEDFAKGMLETTDYET